jgi:hypothetical protein
VHDPRGPYTRQIRHATLCGPSKQSSRPSVPSIETTSEPQHTLTTPRLPKRNTPADTAPALLLALRIERAVAVANHNGAHAAVLFVVRVPVSEREANPAGVLAGGGDLGYVLAADAGVVAFDPGDYIFFLLAGIRTAGLRGWVECTV